MNFPLVHNMIADMEEHIGAAEEIGLLMTAIASSRCEMPCSALGPLAGLLSEHAKLLHATFRELHSLTGKGASCA